MRAALAALVVVALVPVSALAAEEDPCRIVFMETATQPVETPGQAEAEGQRPDETLGAVRAQSGDPVAPPVETWTPVPLNGDGELKLYAEHIGRDQDGHIYARGGIVFTGPGLAACAQRAEFDPASALLVLEEGVQARIDVPGSTIRVLASRAEVQVLLKSGVVYGAAVLTPGLRMTGGRIERKADGTVLAEEVRVTPCVCPAGSRPSWEVAASTVKLGTSGRASFVHGRLRIKGVPVFFVPLGLLPVGGDRMTGLLPPELLLPANNEYEVRIPLYIAASRWWDLTITPIYNGEREAGKPDRGLKVDLLARYAIKRGQGNAGVTVGQDGKVVDEATALFGDEGLARENYGGVRWYAHGTFAHEPQPDWLVRGRIELASDNRWGFDFASSEIERARRDYESSLFLHRGGWLGSWSVGSTYFQDQRIVRAVKDSGGNIVSVFPWEAERTVSLPLRAMVSAPLVPLVSLGRTSGIALGADVAYDLALNLAAPRDGFALGPQTFPGDVDLPPRQAQRLIVRPALAIPVTLAGGGISMLTQVGMRAETARTLESDQLAAESASRVLPFISSDLRIDFGRTFQREKSRIRHTIRPEVSWSYVPTAIADLADPDDPIVNFFGPDPPVPGHTIDVSLVNRILYRPIDPETGRPGAALQLLDMRLGQRFSPDVADRGAPFAVLRAGFPGFSARAAANFDETGSKLQRASLLLGTGGGLSPGGLSGSYSYGAGDPAANRARVDQVALAAWWVPGRMFPSEGAWGQALRRLRVDSVARYDLQLEKLTSVGGGFRYTSPCECWSVSFGVTQFQDRPTLGWTFKIEPQVPKSTTRIQPFVAGNSS